jgi:hypothetical protein
LTNYDVIWRSRLRLFALARKAGRSVRLPVGLYEKSMPNCHSRLLVRQSARKPLVLPFIWAPCLGCWLPTLNDPKRVRWPAPREPGGGAASWGQ